MARPTYQRVADTLRQRIIAGDYAPGDRLPSRQDLAAEFEVGMRVAADAVQQLVAGGYVVSRTGSGSYVRSRPPVRRLTRSWYREARSGSPFRADMAAQAVRGGWESSSRSTTAPEAIAHRLAIDPDDPVMRTQYTFTGDDEPVMLSTSWEPLEITRGTEVVLPENGVYSGRGVVERMRAIGQRIVQAGEIVTARPASADEADNLQVTRGSVVLVIQRTYYTEDCPVETADIVVPPDRYELAYMIPVGQDGT
ncbi:GntR family transcriptional regulator [Nocardiopsis terrae]|uniref:GntR family transcriptional regulator n=1 Tax=Nocardiopsis terrae TaxID=372655 RepID=A0ABR9HAJ1_9ACTN|nr:GntR family transcriptional regulator [Nocardiopsis terrae]MBE1456037.1 GntR family transcriptional regulator [Nocardiopsis terrae]GHC96196.1 GntR family transcriptional regulator [Nocardiopsis terrae]